MYPSMKNWWKFPSILINSTRGSIEVTFTGPFNVSYLLFYSINVQAEQTMLVFFAFVYFDNMFAYTVDLYSECRLKY